MAPLLASYDQPAWDPTQFKLQPDGTFRISIRGMAAMAGIAVSGLSQSLSSAVHESPLPCARSLAAQGFEPVHVSSWGATGGIPESAAPYILEHYGITASSPSDQARAVLLAFSRVGINAYLKERLGVSRTWDTQIPQKPVEMLPLVNESITLLERLGGMDDRAEMLLRDVVLNHVLNASGGSSPKLTAIQYSSLSEYLQRECECPSHKCTPLATKIGKQIKRLYRESNGRDPQVQKQLVNGRNCDVALYEVDFLGSIKPQLVETITEFLKPT